MKFGRLLAKLAALRGPGGETGRRKGLKPIEHPGGKPLDEWSQSRGSLSIPGGGNPELSPAVRPGKCRDLTAPA